MTAKKLQKIIDKGLRFKSKKEFKKFQRVVAEEVIYPVYLHNFGVKNGKLIKIH